jgi:radical SAM superfamily enzyme YgiQ (UPF0313 family)
MLVQKKSVKDIINRCKRLNKKVVCGGPLFKACRAEFSHADHLIIGEAENIFPKFIKDLKNNSANKVYIENSFPNISKTPLPDWNLIRKRNYASMAIQYSRGCPFNCEFCDVVIMNGHVPRTKGDGQILAELDSLYDRGWRSSVFFVDDNFIGNKVKIKKLLPKIAGWMRNRKYPFTFITEASLNLSDDKELMRMMVEAGFNGVFLGLETPNEESLSECNKFQNINRDLVSSVKRIQNFGMQVMGGFIVGFDNDSPKIFDQQIKFIQNSGVVTAMVGLLTAIPGTKLFQRLKQEGRLVQQSSGNNTDGSLNFIPKMNRDKLVEGYKQLLKTIYSPKKYYERIATFLEDYHPKGKRKIVLGNIYRDSKAFLKSMWRLGLISRSRKYYWKLILRCLVKYPKKFPIAVTMAIYGFHFQKITEKF